MTKKFEMKTELLSFKWTFTKFISFVSFHPVTIRTKQLIIPGSFLDLLLDVFKISNRIPAKMISMFSSAAIDMVNLKTSPIQFI